MTQTTNARIAGFTFLFYIAAGIASMALYTRVSRGEDSAGRLAAISQHATGVGVVIILLLAQCLSALVLAVTLYAITRDQDRDLAMLAMLCRTAEGILSGVGVSSTLAVMDLARTMEAGGPDLLAKRVLGSYLLRDDFALTASFFAVGSILFSYLLLRARMIPVILGWLGVVASALLVVGLPLQFAGFVRGPITQFLWLPMFAFEVPLGLLLLIKGVRVPGSKTQTTSPPSCRISARHEMVPRSTSTGMSGGGRC